MQFRTNTSCISIKIFIFSSIFSALIYFFIIFHHLYSPNNYTGKDLHLTWSVFAVTTVVSITKRYSWIRTTTRPSLDAASVYYRITPYLRLCLYYFRLQSISPLAILKHSLPNNVYSTTV